MFQEACGKLGMVVTEEYTSKLDENNHTVGITVASIPTKTLGVKITKWLYGAFFPTEQAYFEDAYEACLQYLVDEGLLIIDDYNYALLQKKSTTFSKKTSWELILNDVAE